MDGQDFFEHSIDQKRIKNLNLYSRSLGFGGHYTCLAWIPAAILQASHKKGSEETGPQAATQPSATSVWLYKLGRAPLGLVKPSIIYAELSNAL